MALLKNAGNQRFFAALINRAFNQRSNGAP